MRLLIFFLFLMMLPLLPGVLSAQQARAGPHPAAAPFTLNTQEGVQWLVMPAGKRFFSLGVCCVDPGTTWPEYNPKNPGYAAWKSYPDAASWADTTVARLKSWGFTTIGGWSDYGTLKRSKQMDLPYTLVLHVGATSGAPWFDMWDPKIIRTMDEVARKQILPVRDDPRLLGYYSDNEMGWWNAPLFQMTLEQKSQSGQRRRLIQLLRARYHDDWKTLRQDFLPEGANSFAALERGGKLYLRPGGNGMRVIQRFVGLLAERYYALVRQIVRKYDRRGLLLGDRYQSFYYPEVAQASRRYVDAVSTNLNAHWNDGTILRFYLDTLYSLTQKPILVGEFYMAATENRTGNKNNNSGFPVVPTQKERAANARVTLERLLHTPYVVGADWFQYYDEPTHGRGDGENYNMGLVDIADQPYTELTNAFGTLDLNRQHASPVAARPNVLSGVPPAPQEPTGNWKPMQALQSWDRERGFVPPKSRYPLADLYLCWDKEAVYVGLYSIEIAEEGYYKEKRVPQADRTQWRLTLNGKKPSFRVRLGAKRPPSPEGAETGVTFLGSEDGVRSIAVARLPAALFGKESLRAGDTIRFSSSLVTPARAYKMEWAGRFTLAE